MAEADPPGVAVVQHYRRGNVALMSKKEARGWDETVHLLSSPANAERLMRSIRDADAGKTTERELAEPRIRRDASSKMDGTMKGS